MPTIVTYLMFVSAIEVLDIDVSSVSILVEASATFSMFFTMPILEADYDAFADIILQSYSAMPGKKLYSANLCHRKIFATG